MASRFSRVLPWVSLAWGLASGVLLARRFDSAPKLLAFAVALLLASAALGVWSTWVARLAVRAKAHDDLLSAPNETILPALSAPSSFRPALGELALRYRERIEWAAVTFTQIFAQYILMFSIGFLWSARTWFHLALCVAVAASTLWDPLFNRLVRFDSYRLTVRSLCVALAASFLVGVLAPARVVQGPALAAIAAAIGAFPWRFFRSGLLGFSHMGVRAFLARWVPSALLAGVIALHVKLGGSWRFPVLSVWVRKPHFVWQDAQGEWKARAGSNPGARFDPRSALLDARTAVFGDDLEGLFASAPAGGRLCCVTPLIAPHALQSDVLHEWWVGNERIDVIALPAFQGRDEDSAFRTFSCKKNLPAGVNERGVECRVYIGTTHGKRVQVGGVFASARRKW